MLIVTYNPDSTSRWTAVADGYVDELVDDLVSLNKDQQFKDYTFLDLKNNRVDMTMEYSTENIFTGLRLAVVQGRLDHNLIKFRFNGADVIVNEFGAITKWPNGFCDSNTNKSVEIIKLAMKKRNEKMTLQKAKMLGLT